VKSFLVEFKPKSKDLDSWSHKIKSQDKETAEKWGEISIKSQKRDPSNYRIVVTEIIETTAPKTEEKPKEEVKVEVKPKPKRSPKKTMRNVIDQAVKSQST
jgi:hypothetical protein